MSLTRDEWTSGRINEWMSRRGTRWLVALQIAAKAEEKEKKEKGDEMSMHTYIGQTNNNPVTPDATTRVHTGETDKAPR